MKIYKNQILQYKHLLSYTCSVKKEELLKLVDFMCSNMNVLNNTVNGFPLIITECCDNECSEILIPIEEKRNDFQSEFRYRHDFRIENALSVRYTGSISDIDNAKEKLIRYIEKNSLTVKGPFIYSVMNIDSKEKHHIIDVYLSCS